MEKLYKDFNMVEASSSEVLRICAACSYCGSTCLPSELGATMATVGQSKSATRAST